MLTYEDDDKLDIYKYEWYIQRIFSVYIFLHNV
jgi:hypothetical protein